MGGTALQNVPPQNLEAEQSLLGSVLLENEALFKVLEIIKTDDFYRESNRQIYQAMIDLYEKNEPTDLITVTEVLKRKNKLEEVGGASYLADLLENIPTAANIEYYAKIVRQKSILRNLIHSATEIVAKATTAEENVEDILDFSEKTIFQISEEQTKQSFYPLKTILKSTFKDIERLYEKKQLITGVPSGFTELDSKTGGVVVLNGRIYGSGDRNRKIFCLDWQTGKELFSLKEMAPATLIANDGILYIYSESGKIFLVS